MLPMTITDQKVWAEVRRLAKAEGASDSTVAKWRQRRVPADWRLLLAARARDEGNEALADELLSTTNLKKAS